jgi:hypothetical protein
VRFFKVKSFSKKICVRQGAPEQTDEGELGVRRIRLRGATLYDTNFQREKGQPTSG